MKQVTQEQYDQLPDWAKPDYEVKPEKWVPDVSEDEPTYFATVDGCITNHILYGLTANALLAGNGFTTKEKAEQAESVLRPIRRVVQFLVENDVDIDLEVKYYNGNVVDIDLITDDVGCCQEAIGLLEKGVL